MRKLAVMVIAALIGGAMLAASSAAQDPPPPSVTVKTKVSPNKAGTPKKPQGVRLSFSAHLTYPEGFERPIATRAVILFPKGGIFNGGKYPKCSQSALARGGTSACPAHSIMGTGTAVGYADTVLTRPKITIVNGGASRVYGFVVLTNPARVQAPVPGVLTRMKGKWSYRLEINVPKVLQIVAGVPISIRDLSITAGGKSFAKDWIATTYCPKNKKWPYQATAYWTNGTQTEYEGSTPCRR